MICQRCGVEAATKHVTFYQNIGLLVMRLGGEADGEMCKSCIHRVFWSYTLITLLLGWWGLISLVLTPVFLLNNIFRYIGCLGMKPAPAGAIQPSLSQDVIRRMQPHTQQLIERLNRGEDFATVVEDIGQRADCTPAQVALYVNMLAESAERA